MRTELEDLGKVEEKERKNVAGVSKLYFARTKIKNLVILDKEHINQTSLLLHYYHY